MKTKTETETETERQEATAPKQQQKYTRDAKNQIIQILIQRVMASSEWASEPHTQSTPHYNNGIYLIALFSCIRRKQT